MSVSTVETGAGVVIGELLAAGSGVPWEVL
jgi:hypothetical protein